MTPATPQSRYFDQVGFAIRAKQDGPANRFIAVIPIRSHDGSFAVGDALISALASSGVQAHLADFHGIGREGRQSSHGPVRLVEGDDWLPSLAADGPPLTKLLSDPGLLRQAMIRRFSAVDQVLCCAGGLLDTAASAQINPIVLIGACDATVLICDSWRDTMNDLEDATRLLQDGAFNCLGVLLDQTFRRTAQAQAEAVLGRLRWLAPNRMQRWQRSVSSFLADV